VPDSDLAHLNSHRETRNQQFDQLAKIYTTFGRKVEDLLGAIEEAFN
jgi:hypothetical protein